MMIIIKLYTGNSNLFYSFNMELLKATCVNDDICVYIKNNLITDFMKKLWILSILHVVVLDLTKNVIV